MRDKLAVVVTVLAAAYIVAAAQQNPFVGRWNLTGTGSDNHLIYFLEVKQVGDHLEGMLAGALFIAPFFLFSGASGTLADQIDKSRIARVVKVAEIGIMD